MTHNIDRQAYDFVGHALNALGVGVWSWKGSPVSVQCCPVTAALFDVPVTDGAMGLPLDYFAASVHPDDRAGFADAIGRAQCVGGPFSVQYRTLNAAGTVRRVLDRGEFMVGPTGRVVAANGLVFDVTDREASNWAGGEPYFSTALRCLPPLEQAPGQAPALYDVLGRMGGEAGPLMTALTKHVLVMLGREMAAELAAEDDTPRCGKTRTLN